MFSRDPHADQIDRGEYHYPHDVDKVPVQRCQVDTQSLAVCQDPLSLGPSPDRVTQNRQEPDYPYGDVGAVQAREGKECRTEKVGLGGQPVVVLVLAIETGLYLGLGGARLLVVGEVVELEGLEREGR